MFEVLEHVPEPAQFLAQVLTDAEAPCVVFTTELFQGAPPHPDQWPYYAFQGGQHVSFYQARTLRFLGGRMGLTFQSIGGLHVLSRRALNEAVVRIATGRASYIISRYARRRLGSRTQSDHLLMLDTACRRDAR